MISFPNNPSPSLTPLIVRSGYSLLRGTAMPEQLVEMARQMGHTHLALTDVNGLYGATVFHKAAKAGGIEPIIGAELLGNGDRHLFRNDNNAKKDPVPISVVALVHSEEGYSNLCRLITRLHCGDDNEHIEKFHSKFGGKNGDSENRDCPHFRRLKMGPVPIFAGLHLIVDEPATAMALLDAGVSRDQLWLGVDTSQTPAQIRRLSDFSRETGLPRVLTARALIAREDDLDTARLLEAIRTGKTFDTVDDRELPSPKAHLRSREQLLHELDLMADMEDLSDAADNNRRLAEECAAFQLLPRKPVFPAFPCPDGLSPAQYLRKLCDEGMIRRYGKIGDATLFLPHQPADGDKPVAGNRVASPIFQRLEKELDLIVRLGFSEYFLVVWDIVSFARRRGAPVAGRGSGASSLVAYLLGITNVCPLTYELPFERFLHEKREDFPDLDVDFCWRLRDEAIDYAFRRWGVNNVAMVSMHATFQPQSALRETAKACGLSDGQISRMDEGWHGGRRLPPCSDDDRGNMAANDGRHATPTVTVTDSRRGARPTKPALDPKRLAALSRRILGLPHNLSVHPGGIVIAPGGVDAHVPLQPAAKGVLITQMDKDGVEDVRLVKIDLLGNRNLSTVRYATDLIRRRHGVEIDIEALPKDDPETIDLLRDGRTIGCNQLESPAMRNLLRMMQPSNTRDVMKALALIRPGAASIGMKEVFVRRQRGIDPVPPDRPEVAAVLGATHGVMLYEDDVMLTAAAMLRCELPQADRFRKAVQKCQDDAQRLAISREFLGRCQANGVDLEYAKGIWVQMAKFNAYSFCRAHAASYAVLAYAGAYLKTHYPLEFWLASLNNNQSMYPPRAYVEQAKRQGVQFLLPDVNRSEAEFSLEERRLSPFSSLSLENADSPRSPEEGASPHLHAALRVGLGRVEGLGPANVEAILNARRRGPFTGLSDCLGRIGLGRNEARSLVLCGAFDWTGRTRPTLMMELNLFYALGSWRHSPDVVLLPTGPTIPNVPGDYSPRQKYLQERHILGLSVGEHILAFYRGLTRGVGILPARHAGVSPAACSSSNSAERQASPQQQWEVDSRALSSCVGRTVRIAGMLEAYRATPTQKGETMLFLTLDDEYGVFEATLFPPQARALGMSLDRYGPYVIIGKVEQQYGVVSVTADQVELVNCEGLLENEGDGE